MNTITYLGVQYQAAYVSDDDKLLKCKYIARDSDNAILAYRHKPYYDKTRGMWLQSDPENGDETLCLLAVTDLDTAEYSLEEIV